MNDTKMDIQRSGETIERTAVKYSAKATKGLAKLTKMLTLYGIKMFANPLNAIKKDGPNKTLIHTPELTKEEAKVMIAKLREAEILATYREVEPSGREIRRGISIHNQEKMAKCYLFYSCISLKQYPLTSRHQGLTILIDFVIMLYIFVLDKLNSVS